MLLAVGTAWAAFEQEAGSPYPTGAEPYARLHRGLQRRRAARPRRGQRDHRATSTSICASRPAASRRKRARRSPRPDSGPSFAAVADFNARRAPGPRRGELSSTAAVSVLTRQAGGGFTVQQHAPSVTDTERDRRRRLQQRRPDRPRRRALTPAARSCCTSTTAAAASPPARASRPGPTRARSTSPTSTATAPRHRGHERRRLDASRSCCATARHLLAESRSGRHGAAGPRRRRLQRRRPDRPRSRQQQRALCLVLLRNATGFDNEAGSPITVGGGPTASPAADFDRDGRPTSPSRRQQRGRAAAQRGGGFTPETPITIAAQPTASPRPTSTATPRPSTSRRPRSRRTPCRSSAARRRRRRSRRPRRRRRSRRRPPWRRRLRVGASTRRP